MKKTYQMILALAVMLLTAMNVDAAGKIYKTELAAGMFKAWDSNLPGANEVADPDPEPKNNGNFGCAYDLFKLVGAYGTIYGSSSVYYLWYADLTGTQTMTVTGTPGMNIRLMLNRVPFVEGGTGDADGGAYIEWIETLGEDGTFTFDFTQKAELVEAGYIHLNAMKVPSSGPEGVVTSIQLKGTVVPMTGILSLINNGEVESDDLSSFPVSYDGPNNGDTANDLPTIVDDGYVGKGLKVTSFPEATQTWHTQFFLKFDEALQSGDKWRLVFYAKADEPATITTSAQGQPRAWQSGIDAIGNINVTDEWQRFEYSGEVTDGMAGNNGWLSMAFDLNNGAPKSDGGFEVSTKSNNFYFDEIEFGRDLGGTSALANVKASFQYDVVRIDFGGDTNIKDLVKAADGKRVIFPNEYASVTVNGEQTTLFSVEGRPDGYLYVFIDKNYAENETDKVLVNFTNPTDELCIKFTSGKWEGEAVPNVANLECTYTDGVGENFTYLSDAPMIASANPEDGSFNLPVGLKEFKVTFGTNADASAITAKLDNEALTVSPNEGLAKEFTFTRTAEGDLTNGTHILIIDKVYPEARIDDNTFATYELKLSFGPVVVDENDKEEVLMTDRFSAKEGNGPGWLVNKDDGTLQPANSGAGCRLMHDRNDAFTTDILYLAQRNGACPSGVALYGLEDDYQLVLEAKTYHLTLRASQWDRDDDRTLRVQVVKKDAVSTENGTLLETATEADVIAEDYKPITKKLASKEAESFDLAVTVTEPGNYVVRLVPGNKDGNPAGYSDGCAIGNIKFEYVPDVAGVQEMKAVENALTEAKQQKDNMGAERYAGEALTALASTIEKIETEKATYTSPSACQAAVDELAAAVDALKKHYEQCNTYDDLAGRLADVVRINADNKFNVTEEYATVKALAEKYHATSQWVNVSEDPDVENWQKQVNFDVLTDDAALNEAVAELKDIVIYTEKTFTILKEGEESVCHNTTGVAAMIERLRLGAETLKTLGADSNNALVVAANNALTDDDALAENIKSNVKQRLYEKLMDSNNEFFQQTMDEATLETVTANPVDLTVFVKNPNLYAREYTQEVTGWEKISGNAQAWSSWGNDSHSKNTPYAEDCKLHPGWHSKASVEQTITDLPAGVYTIQFKGDDNDTNVGTYGYVKTSATPAVAEGAELDMDLNYAGYSYINGGMKPIENITVTDGQLTLGFVWGPECQAFMDGVRIKMTGKAEGFDYGKAYADGIETVKIADKVNNGAIYNLAGQKVGNSFKGIVIMNGKKFVVK